MPDEVGSPTQRVRNRWGEGERLRTEILDAAVRLFSELEGEEALTIRGVARAVVIAPASIYEHFADKAALVRGVVEYDYERLSAVMRQRECPSTRRRSRAGSEPRTRSPAYGSGMAAGRG